MVLVGRTLSLLHAHQSMRMLTCTAECSCGRQPLAMATPIDATSERCSKQGRRARRVGIVVRRARACLTVATVRQRTPALPDRRSLSGPRRPNRRPACRACRASLVSQFYQLEPCPSRGPRTCPWTCPERQERVPTQLKQLTHAKWQVVTYFDVLCHRCAGASACASIPLCAGHLTR